jgi:hypothetical protein
VEEEEKKSRRAFLAGSLVTCLKLRVANEVRFVKVVQSELAAILPVAPLRAPSTTGSVAANSSRIFCITGRE